MKRLDVCNGPKDVSRIILGCMRMPALTTEEAERMISSAFDLGVDYFDHATCYGDGEAEIRFGDAFLKTGIRREDAVIQSKCGLNLKNSEFDWTKENILSSVDDSLRRMKTDYLDVLLLHRAHPAVETALAEAGVAMVAGVELGPDAAVAAYLAGDLWGKR